MFGLQKYFICLLYCFYQVNNVGSDSPPVVLWHGLGDSCCFSFSMGAIKKMIQDAIPGIYVHSIRLGNNEIEDVERSYFGNVNEQVQEACEQLSKDERLKNGYNAIGFSQGAQFLRALIQRCPNPPALNYISFGGQHQGVFGCATCAIMNHRVCDYIKRMVKYGAYLKAVQERFILATYWHDPYQEQEFKNKNILIADINNEITINETYRDSIRNLRNMVLVKFGNDTTVYPTESEWFGFYKPGQEVVVLPLQQTDLYREDRLGLRSLDKSGRLHMYNVAEDHLQFSKIWFTENIVKRFLK